jgi:hypothetical protein
MKVYLVFRTDYDGFETVDRIFTDEERAREYVKNKNLVSKCEWFQCEMAVEE